MSNEHRDNLFKIRKILVEERRPEPTISGLLTLQASIEAIDRMISDEDAAAEE